MYNCNKCGNEIKQDDLFCTKCGNRIELVCRKCGNKYGADDKFCEVCGEKLTEDVEIEFAVPDNAQRQANHKGKFILLVGAVIIFMAVGVVGAYNYFNRDKTNKADNEQTAKSNSSVLVEQNGKNNNVMSEEQKIAQMPGVIKGNDVIVRAEASITGSVIDYVDEGRKVTVLNKYKCEDQNAAIINVQAMTVTVDGKDVVLKKGQAVKIISFEGNSYKCQTEINKKSVYVYLKQQEFKKVYGDLWYQIQLDNGKIGWVYGDYVLSNGLKPFSS